MPINVTTSNEKISAQVAADKIAASVSGGSSVSANVTAGFGAVGPQGPQGATGVVTVTAPITNSGTTTAANVGISLGDGLSVSGGSLRVTPGTYATLVNGLVPSNQLPSYVDDVLEYANTASLPFPGETGKIYVAINTGKIYRWSGSAYFEISTPPANTDAVPEGSSNFYFTNARARNAFGTGTTGQVITWSGGQWTAAAPAVSSVAGRTGAITLAVGDVTNAVSTSDSRLTNSRSPTAHAASHKADGEDALFDQNLNTTDAVTFDTVSLPNGTKITEGSWDNGTGGQNGISLHCTVGYELNWQGGHIQSTSDGGTSAATIWCDSPILWQGESGGITVESTGITFPDGSQQRIAGVASAHSHAAGEVAYRTAILLHFDGDNEGTTFTDSSSKNWTVSRIGSAVTSTTQSKFGGSSLAVGSGDGVSIAADPTLNFGTHDFTIELWAYHVSGTFLCGQRLSGSDCSIDFFTNAVYIGSDAPLSFTSPPLYGWHHYALVRHAGWLRVYIDGAEADAYEIGTDAIPTSTAYFGVGRDEEGNLTSGYFDEFRLVLGTAIYRAPFVPPTAPHGLGLELATVATSASYDDLVDLPTLFSGDYGDLANAPTLGAVATSNDYGDLDNLPTLGSAAASDTTDFAAATHSHAWSDLTSGVPTTISGYGITDAVASDDSRLSDNRNPTAHKTSHATGGSDALSAADIGAAAASHSHAWSDITSGVPSTFAPSAHKTSHATGGSDALTASDIGAAASSHTHAASDITSGTIATARLGSGTASSTTFLRGDSTWAAAGSSSASDLTSGTLSDARLSTNAQAATNLYLWSSFR